MPSARTRPQESRLARRSMLRRTVTAALSGLALPAIAGLRQSVRASDPLGDADMSEIRARAEAMMREARVPGVAVALSLDGVDRTFGLGLASQGTRAAMEDNTLFAMSTLTQPVTAVAAARLHDLGKLDLDRPVAKYLPALKLKDGAANEITVSHLLSHTSGLDPDGGDEWDSAGSRSDALARWVEQYRDLRILTAPGTTFEPNDLGYDLAGRVIEVAAGVPFHKAIQEHVTVPLGMERSVFADADARGWTTASGHMGRTMREHSPFNEERAEWPDGGLVSTARDQLRFARMFVDGGLAADGSRFLSEDVVSRLTSPLVAAGSDPRDTASLAWLVEDAPEARFLSLDGSVDGFESISTIVPARRFAVVVLANSESGEELVANLTDWTITRLLGIEVEAPA
ncbi:MAG: serine hydrolase domain-containing protein [Chloroflexota bacterium]